MGRRRARQAARRARSRTGAGRWVGVADGAAIFGLQNAIHRDKCEEVRADVEKALTDHFGAPIPVRMVVDSGAAASDPDEPADDTVDLTELRDAPGVGSAEAYVLHTFPGATEE